jgi:hypothetical protein
VGGGESPGSTIPARYRLALARGCRAERASRRPARHDGDVTAPLEASDTAGDTAGDTASDTAVENVTGEPPRRRRRVDKGLVVVSLAIAIGVVLVARGLAVGITGDERANLPDHVESVEPVFEAVQVLSQTRVFVDLDFGYTGVLVIDGVEIPTIDVADVVQDQGVGEPGSQIDLPPETLYEKGNATLTFTPSDDALVTEFDTGLHRAQVIFWRVDEGRVQPRSFTWTFTVV